MNMEDQMANFSGTWRMKSSENFEELLKALGKNSSEQNTPPKDKNVFMNHSFLGQAEGSVNVFLRKIAVAAASRPSVAIEQKGETLSIQTSTSVRTTQVSFTVGQVFNETTVDGRPCTSFPKWDTNRKITCEQTLLKGEGPQTSWTRELTDNGELILTMSAGDVVCTRVYERE